MQLTEVSQKLFADLAKDACNWNGTPLLGGNVAMNSALRGNLTQLKKAGLLYTESDCGEEWVYFTKAGEEYAASLGINI